MLLALVACLLVATSIGQLAKHLPSAGSIYTYPAEAIHPALGFLVGWGYALVEALLGPITMVLFGYLISSIANSEWGWPFTATWVIFMIVGAVLVAGLNAGTLATTRTWYAMSRIGLLPSPLARIHPRWNSPAVGVGFQLVLTLAIGLPIGLHFGPTIAFVFLATILTGIMIAIYMVFNLSCLLYYLRKRRQEFNVLLHAVIPVVGILAFIPAWLTALGIGSSFLKFVTPLSYPASETGLAIGIWYVIGLVVLAYLYARHPERLPQMKKVFADDGLPSGEPVTSGEPL